MNNYIKIFRIVLIAAIWPVLLLPQTYKPEFENLTPEQGLSQGTVTCIKQDAAGYLWIGTRAGLNRYDGYSFRKISLPADSLTDQFITSLANGPQGSMIIGTSRGRVYRHNSETNSVTELPIRLSSIFEYREPKRRGILYHLVNYAAGAITCLLIDSNENIWVGTKDYGLILLPSAPGSDCVHFFIGNEDHPLNSDCILALEIDGGGNVLAGTPEGILKISPVKINSGADRKYKVKNLFSLKENAVEWKTGVTALALYDSLLYIGTEGKGLLTGRMANDSLIAVTEIVPAGSGRMTITAVKKGTGGDLWIGTLEKGLAHHMLKEKTTVWYQNDSRSENSLNDNDIIALEIDRTGLIWVGTLNGYGINKLNPRKVMFNTGNETQGLTSFNGKVITAVAGGNKNRLVLGSWRDGIMIINGGERILLRNENAGKSGIKGRNITSLLSASDNTIWAADAEGEIYIIKNNGASIKQLSAKAGKKAARVTSLAEGRNGVIWAATAGDGAYYYTVKGDSVIASPARYNTIFPGALPSKNIDLVYADKGKEIWMVLDGQTICRHDYTSNEFTVLDGRITAGVLSLCDDGKNIWAGTEGGGLFIIDKRNDRIITIGTPPQLRHESIQSILAESPGILWLGTNSGLYKFNAYHGSVIQFTKRDGLMSNQFTRNGAVKLSSGEFVFGGVNGYDRFYPPAIVGDDEVSAVAITLVHTNTREIFPGSHQYELKSDENRIRFEFSILDYTDPLKNRFAYRLEGYEQQWHYCGSDSRYAEYNGLPSGRYRFVVKGANSSGQWSGNEAEFMFQIPVPLWQKWWFITGIFVLISLLAAYPIFIKLKQQKALRDIRTKLSADLHDSVGSGLTEIALVAEVIERDSSIENNRERLKTIKLRARELIDTMSDIVWLVNPAAQSLKDLMLRLHDIYMPLCESLGIKLVMTNMDKLDLISISTDKKQNLYLLLKEAVNNSVKYARPSEIGIGVILSEDEIEISVMDDGIGFDGNKIIPGNGLKTMRQRAGWLGMELEIRSAGNKGTKILIRGEKL